MFHKLPGESHQYLCTDQKEAGSFGCYLLRRGTFKATGRGEFKVFSLDERGQHESTERPSSIIETVEGCGEGGYGGATKAPQTATPLTCTLFSHRFSSLLVNPDQHLISSACAQRDSLPLPVIYRIRQSECKPYIAAVPGCVLATVLILHGATGNLTAQRPETMHSNGIQVGSQVDGLFFSTALSVVLGA